MVDRQRDNAGNALEAHGMQIEGHVSEHLSNMAPSECISESLLQGRCPQKSLSDCQSPCVDFGSEEDNNPSVVVHSQAHIAGNASEVLGLQIGGCLSEQVSLDDQFRWIRNKGGTKLDVFQQEEVEMVNPTQG